MTDTPPPDADAALRELTPRLRKWANRFARVHDCRREDAFADALLGAWKGLLSYRPGPATWQTWALSKAAYAMQEGLRRSRPFPRSWGGRVEMFDLDTPFTLASGERSTYAASRPCPHAEKEARARAAGEEIDHVLRHLRDRHEVVLRRYYLDDCQLRKIAEEVGVSEGQVCNDRQAALARLRKLHEEGLL